MRFAALLFPLVLAASPARASDDALTLADVKGPIAARNWFPFADDPAINYATGAIDNRVSRLMAAIDSGKTVLEPQGETGYLTALLAALGISQKSQILVFSKTSLQQRFISPQTPRAIYFTDDVAVAFIRDAPFIEIAAQDAKQGLMFYVVDQKKRDAVSVWRRTDCLNCHVSLASAGVAGTLLRSMAVDQRGFTMPSITNLTTDHTTPMAERWGGWFVTGLEDAQHLGNVVMTLKGGETSRDAVIPAAADSSTISGYLSRESDAAALMVFDHQTRLINLITRLGWDTRVAAAQRERGATTAAVVDELVKNDARELVDYMLFIDEAPVLGRFTSASGFAQEFSRRGPRDAKGRSLYQLDLTKRLLRYPCSYLVYSPAFDALPDIAREAVYRRLWDVLSGKERDRRYERISAADRKAIVEILRGTKPGLPKYFR